MDNVYDFYKPVPNSEYPTVDGHLSINVYLNALDQCYNSLKMKYRQKHDWEPMFTNFDYFCFHTPFSKMVQKSFMNLIYHDVKRYEQKHQNFMTTQAYEEIRQASNNFTNGQNPKV